MSATITVQYVIPEDCREYLASSARMRCISETQLMRKVVEFVLRDQLLLSILDDADRPGPKTMPKRNTRGMYTRPQQQTIVPRPERAQKAEAQAQRSASVLQRPNRQTFSFHRSEPKTRTELQEELHQAVLNTGGTLVK